MKKLFIKTYGCQMNVYDSARMADLLARHRLCAGGCADDADMVILNTCHIREKAAEKVYSELGTLKRIKDARKARRAPMLIAVAGCVAQAEGAEIIARQTRGRHRRRSAILSSPAGNDRADRARNGPRARNGFSGRRQIRCAAGSSSRSRARPRFSRCRKVATSSARSASCLTRAARNISRPVAQIVSEARRLVDAWRARDHAARPERECLSRRRA